MARSGNKLPAKIPAFIPSCSIPKPSFNAKSTPPLLAITRSVTEPTSCGPSAAPISPPAAINAYISTPPFGNFSADTIKLPGQSIETQSPVNAQPIKPITGTGDTAAKT